MDHIRNIQETIDEHRESLPTGVVTDVMRECQSAYKALPKLWKVHYVEIRAISKNDAASAHNARIVEEDADINLKYFYLSRVLDEGKIPPADTHKDIKGEWVIHTSDGRVRVITKVEPFLKRAREE